MNNINLIGRITKEIEIYNTPSGAAVTSFNIAINNGKDKDGKEIQADFPKIKVCGKQAENIYMYCSKGSKIGITGRLKTNSWEKTDGTKTYDTYVFADKIEFLDSKGREEKEEQKSQKNIFEEFGDMVENGNLPF